MNSQLYVKFFNNVFALLGEDSKTIIENRVACVQSLSGTGALRLALQFLNQHHSVKTVFIPKPTWGNHKKLAFHSNYTDVREYTYYDENNKGINISGMVADITNAPDKSIILLHVCAQNPCGVDPSTDDWKSICEVMKQKQQIALFDMAYDGFVTGDPDCDAWPIRYFVDQDMEVIFAQSFAKIFGLYNERCGNLGFVCKNSTIALNVKSQLKTIIRPMYSNPPNHGARIVATILNNPVLMNEW